MTTLTIRDVDEELLSQLRIRATAHGRSMEAEALEILRSALEETTADISADERGLGTLIHQHFAGIGGVELEIPERTEALRFVDFDE